MMRIGPGLVLAVSCSALGGLIGCAGQSAKSGPPGAAGELPPVPLLQPGQEAAFAGSAACAPCHREIFDDHARSTHATTVRGATDAPLIDAFETAQALTDPTAGMTYSLRLSKGKPVFSVRHPAYRTPFEMTPAKEVRAKSKADLYAGVAVMRSATTVDEAAKKITQRIGKPTWTENGQKRIWVVMAGNKCHRLVLTPDGEANVEEASKKEWRGLSALAQQNPCTGEIKRGIASGK